MVYPTEKNRPGPARHTKNSEDIPTTYLETEPYGCFCAERASRHPFFSPSLPMEGGDTPVALWLFRQLTTRFQR